MMKEILLSLVVILAYLAIGYFVGLPVSVAGDWMFNRSEKPLTRFGAVCMWPLTTLIVILAFPSWLYHWSGKKRGKNN